MLPVVLLLLLLFLTQRRIVLSVLLKSCCPLFWFALLSLCPFFDLGCARNGFVSSISRFPALWCCLTGPVIRLAHFQRGSQLKYFPSLEWVGSLSLRRFQMFSFSNGVPFVIRYCNSMPGFLLSGDNSSSLILVG